MDEGIIPTNGPNRKIPCSPWDSHTFRRMPRLSIPNVSAN